MENRDFEILEIRERSILIKDAQKMTFPVARYEDDHGIYFLNGQLEKQYVPSLRKKVTFKEIGMAKAALKRIHSEDENTPLDDPEGHQEAADLFARRSQTYTAEEMIKMARYYWTGHDQCVWDNTGHGEFSRVEEVQAQAKWDRLMEAEKILGSHL